MDIQGSKEINKAANFQSDQTTPQLITLIFSSENRTATIGSSHSQFHVSKRHTSERHII